MVGFFAVFYLMGVLVVRFIRAFPRTCAFMLVVGLVMTVLDSIPTTQAMMNNSGMSNSLAIAVKPVTINWAVAHTCGEMQCDEHRYATMKITNTSGQFFRSFTLHCTTPAGDSFDLMDQSGLSANARDDLRSYTVGDNYSKATCKMSDSQVGKPTEYVDRFSWGDRVPEIMLPEDVD